MLDRPLFLVGAARSGTKYITATLALHEQVAFWDEPKYVWRHGRARASDDYRPASDATPVVSDYIHRSFERYVRRHGASRFLEKTPSNCFRVSFMHQVFPDGLFLHLVRDGRDVAVSALNRWRSSPDDRAIWRRLRNLEIPILELLAYAPDIAREALLRRLQPDRGHVWGPRYPGMLEEIAQLDTASACARQWVESERAARTQLAGIPAEQVLAFRYEEFLLRPRHTIQRIFDFAGLTPSDRVNHAASATVTPERIGGSRHQLPAEDLAKIEAICAPAMREFGILGAEELQARLSSELDRSSTTEQMRDTAEPASS